MKLVFAGLGRSGTSSIVMALEQLGVSTLSQESLFTNPKNHANVNAVLRDEAELDWSMFEGVDATIGWPLCFLYRQQLEQFPEAKCLLNVRDPESWFDSVSRSWKTLGIVRNARFVTRLRHINETLDYLQDHFGGAPNKEKWISAYKAYVDSVKRDVSPERLVIYRVEEGWGSICNLLDLPVPDEAFPRLNVGGEESLRKQIKSLFGLE